MTDKLFEMEYETIILVIKGKPFGIIEIEKDYAKVVKNLGSHVTLTELTHSLLEKGVRFLLRSGFSSVELKPQE